MDVSPQRTPVVSPPKDRPPFRIRVDIRGTVQGVGFRPYVYLLAREHGLAGYVKNGPNGVLVEVEGALQAVDAFISDLQQRLPRWPVLNPSPATNARPPVNWNSVFFRAGALPKGLP